MTATRRTSLRSPFWMALCWLLGLIALITGFGGIGIGSVGDIVFTGLLMGVPGAWVTFRVPLMRVTLTDTGLTNHGLFRNQTFVAVDIQRVQVVEVDSKVVATAYAPVLDLRGNPDGQALMQLAGYSTKKRVGRSRMTRQARLIEQWLSALDHAPV